MTGFQPHGKQTELDALRRENEQLRAELERQWWHNHIEHCDDHWPHPGRCSWPLPAILVDSGESLDHPCGLPDETA
jgi:hypothetical protein